jgi:hypothetical protein
VIIFPLFKFQCSSLSLTCSCQSVLHLQNFSLIGASVQGSGGLVLLPMDVNYDEQDTANIHYLYRLRPDNSLQNTLCQHRPFDHTSFCFSSCMRCGLRTAGSCELLFLIGYNLCSKGWIRLSPLLCEVS